MFFIRENEWNVFDKTFGKSNVPITAPVANHDLRELLLELPFILRYSLVNNKISCKITLTAELPGLTRADITLEARAGELILRGERRDPQATSGSYVQLERGQGPFVRSFVFAEPIDADRIQAELRDGVLTVTVPKASQPQPKRIAVT